MPSMGSPPRAPPDLVLACAVGSEGWAAPSAALTVLFSPQQASKERRQAQPGTAVAAGAPRQHRDPARSASSHAGTGTPLPAARSS